MVREYLSKIEWKIGLKGALAAALSWSLGVGIAKVMNRPDTFVSGAWTVVSTFIILQAHLGGTYRAGFVRFLGVLIGSLFGGIFTTLLGSNIPALSFGVFFVVSLCSILNLKDSIRIACISLSVVMILWGQKPHISPWLFSLYRFIDSTVGILVGISVSRLVWPSKAAVTVKKNTGITLDLLGKLFTLVTSSDEKGGNRERMAFLLIRRIKFILRKSTQFLDETELELLTRSAPKEEWEELIKSLSKILGDLETLETFSYYNVQKILDESLSEQLQELIETTEQAFKTLANALREETKETTLSLHIVLSELTEELLRFRTTRTTRRFDLKEVEGFFVFFYTLRSVVEELLHIERSLFPKKS